MKKTDLEKKYNFDLILITFFYKKQKNYIAKKNFFLKICFNILFVTS